MFVLQSIRNRLALSAIGLVLAVVAVIAGVAYAEARHMAIGTASERLQQVSGQLADMFRVSARQVRDQAATVAARGALGAFIAAPRGATAADSKTPLSALEQLAGPNVISVEAWDEQGKRILATNDTIPEMPAADARELMALAAAPDSVAIGRITGPRGRLAYAVIAAVGAGGGLGAGRPRRGYVVERRLVGTSTQVAAQVTALIGSNASFTIGNADRGLWTNFVDSVAAPPFVDDGQRAFEYSNAAGKQMLTSVSTIPYTPWALAVEFPRSITLGPVHEMMVRLAMFAVLLLIAAAVGVWTMSHSLTRPIGQLARAADAISVGDYSQRADAHRSDEIGALGVAFNTMADRVGHSRDSLEHKMGELAATQQRLSRVIGSSGAVLYELRSEPGKELVLEWISDNVTKILGYEPDEVKVPHWWTNNLHPADRVRLTVRGDAHANGDGAHLEAHAETPREGAVEYRFRHKDGRYRLLREEQRRATDDASQPDKVIGAWMDLTEQRQLEAQLRQAQKMEAIGRLAGGVAHDFNNLLTVILAECQYLLGEPSLPPDVRTECIDQIGKAAERAALLTRQLLTFSRQQLVEPMTLDLNIVVTDIDKMLRRLIGEDVDLRVSISPDSAITVADRGQLDQVIVNLVVNARDAMPVGGVLTIETGRTHLDRSYADTHADVTPGDYVVLAVSDTGIGMDDEIKSHIFEPFFTTKDDTKGTGLGLATCYAIARQYGGHIAVYSELGFGTTMKVYLPSTSGVAVSPPLVSTSSERGTETVLLVEDDAAVRRLTARMLEERGYVVIQAADATDAIDALERHPDTVHLLFTDVVLPGVGGRTLADRVRERRPDIAVLFTSGYSDDVILQHKLTAHGVVMLHKPFTVDTLSHKVREALARPGLV